MCKNNINRAELHNYVNNRLSSLVPLPDSPISVNFKGFIFTVKFNRISDTAWDSIFID
jgi:hypothetical protein